MHLHEKRISGKTIYKGRIITLQKDEVMLEDQSIAQREVVRHPGGCCVVAIDSDKNILMVEQYRYPYAKTVVEIPAGKLDSCDEDPLEATKRELSEETGFSAKNWHSLGVIFPTPGYCDENLYLYMATGLVKDKGQHTDEGEFLDVIKMPFNEAAEKCLSGELKDAKTVAAILKAHILIESGKIKV